MRSYLFIGAILPLTLACPNPRTDPCAVALKAAPAIAVPFCTKVTASATVPAAFAAACGKSAKRLSNACRCVYPATGGATPGKPKVTPTSKPPGIPAPKPPGIPAPKAQGTPAPKAKDTPAPKAKGTPAPKAQGTPVSKPTNAPAPKAKGTPAPKHTDPPPAPGPPPPGKKPAKVTLATTKSSSAPKAVKTSGSWVPTDNAPAACIATKYAQIAGMAATCQVLILDNIYAPPGSPILLTALKPGAKVIFSGTTTFGTTLVADFDPIVVSGIDLTITGAPGHVIEGNGQAYWDGGGSNTGGPKPNHFIVVKKMARGIVSNLNIRNWPVHCFSITGCVGTVFTGMHLDNSEGDAPNARSGGKPAAHNTDGFDISSCVNILLSDCYVRNQDDCVAVTSGSNITVTGMTCIGGHGMSIGSVGGKSNNVVSGVTFSNSNITDSENGCRIKSNSGTSGRIENVTYKNITLNGITNYGIDVQQDYLNGGATGIPTNQVAIAGVTFLDIHGTTKSTAMNHFVLCGTACSNIQFSGVKISGGQKASKCNFPATGCPP